MNSKYASTNNNRRPYVPFAEILVGRVERFRHRSQAQAAAEIYRGRVVRAGRDEWSAIYQERVLVTE